MDRDRGSLRILREAIRYLLLRLTVVICHYRNALAKRLGDVKEPLRAQSTNIQHVNAGLDRKLPMFVQKRPLHQQLIRRALNQNNMARQHHAERVVSG